MTEHSDRGGFSVRRAVIRLLALCSGLYGATGSAQVTFTRDTASIVASSGGATFGSAWIDFDSDGDLDLFTANFNGQNNALFRNDGPGGFHALSSAEAGSIVSDGGNSFGTSWGDYDNDGDPDAYVANASPSVTNEADFLYANDGDGTFTRVLASPVATAGGFTTGGSWVDYDNDGFLDLFAVNNNQVNFLFHNNGNGTFTRVTTGDIVQSVARFHGCSWSDYDGDGDMDVFIACNIGSTNRLYRNNGDGTFTKVTTGAIVTDVGSAQGASWGDYDNDGDMDLFVPNRSDQNNALYRNLGNGTFAKVTADEAGMIVADGGDSFGSAWSDIDNDGDLDLFVANWSGQDNFLYVNNGDGSFTRELSGSLVQDGGESQAAVFGDYDQDGFDDLFVANGYFINENDFLYRNDGNGNHWLTMSLIGTNSNRSAIGTKVRVKALIGGESVWQLREIAEQTGAFGQSSLLVHVGLGDAVAADSVIIQWPSGLTEYRTGVAADQFMTLIEGAPPATVLLSAVAGDGEVVLRWRKSKIANFDHYAVYADSMPGPSVEVGTVAPAAETTYTVPGLVNHTLYTFRVRVANTDSLLGEYSNERTATPMPLVARQVAAADRWNLLSLPLRTVDSAASVLFPTASSGPYAYSAAGGYTAEANVRHAEAYWVKFSGAQEIGFSGFAIAEDSVHVEAGWNLVGSLSEPLAVASIASDPPGLTTGAFFGYENGYHAVDTIRPGAGYWVRASQEGVLLLSSEQGAASASAIRVRPDGAEPPGAPFEPSVTEGTPESYALLANYPNPFNPSTVVRYELPERSRVVLRVLNVLGQEIARLVDEVRERGVHDARWNADQAPSGIYFCELTATSVSETRGSAYTRVRKMALLR